MVSGKTEVGIIAITNNYEVNEVRYGRHFSFVECNDITTRKNDLIWLIKLLRLI